jgi:ABC-type xylose transport system permease subunit
MGRWPSDGLLTGDTMHHFAVTHVQLFKWLDFIVLLLAMGAACYTGFSNAKAKREGRVVQPNHWFFGAKIALLCAVVLLLCVAIARLN